MSGRRNTTTQSLDQRLIRELTELKQQFIQFKNKQPVGSDVVKAITITDDDGSVVGMGRMPDDSGFGFFVLDSSGNILCKIIGGTIYAYDPTTNKNIMQLLRLPDGTYGIVAMKPGINVTEAYS